MKHIFYLVAIAFIIYEFIWILNPIEQTEKQKRLKEEGKLNKDKKWDDYTDSYKSLLKTKGLTSLIFTLWMFVGLLTFNWVAFLIMLLFNLVIIAPIGRLTRYNIIYTSVHWFNSIIGFLFGIFVIINSYHLKIDIYKYLHTLF